jgi:hypothetical protein
MLDKEQKYSQKMVNFNRPVITLKDKPECDMSGKEYFSNRPTNIKKSKIVSHSQKKEPPSLLSINFKKKEKPNNLFARVIDTDEIENFSKRNNFFTQNSISKGKSLI